MSTAEQRTPWFQKDFTLAEFAQRRHCLAAAIGSGAVAVLRGAPANGAFEVFRQYNDFFYLCGVEVPHAYLLVEGGSARAHLFLPRRNEHLERSDGPQLNCDAADVARQTTGVDEVHPLEGLRGLVEKARTIYLPMAGSEGRQVCRDTIRIARHEAEGDPWADQDTPEQRFRKRLEQVCPQAGFEDLSPLVDRMRLIKSPTELELMRRAGALTAAATEAAIRQSRPGMKEYQLAAIADGIFRDGGAQGPGYTPIIACGKNIWNAHYNRLNCDLIPGELALMDYAPDLGYYTSDIGRLWPVNGRFAPWQRELYQLVLDYHKTLLEVIRPGTSSAAIMDEAAARMRPKIEATRWSRPSFAAAAAKLLEFRGHLSHPVGMAVHDVGNYRDNGPIQPGTVFAVDPQLWVPEEEIYIRVEDTVAVTPGGIEVLTSGVTFEIEELEQLCGAAYR